MLRQDSPNLASLLSDSGPGTRVKVRTGLCRKKLKNGPPSPGIEPQTPKMMKKLPFWPKDEASTTRPRRQYTRSVKKLDI